MEIPEIELNIDSQEIVAINRKLKAVWSYEAAQDLRAWHEEIDREILQDLKTAAEKGQETERKLNKKKIKISYRAIDEDWESTKKD